MQTSALIKQNIAEGNDFEFYPTTDEIIAELAQHIDMHARMLDIGCGNGKVLNALEEAKKIEKFGIELSQTLLAALDKTITVLGTDFHQNTLIDKKFDVIFCNPPYSEYEAWTRRIILEGQADDIFLVIPSRWQNSQSISAALNMRDVKIDVIGSYDFLNADRAARAKVDLVKVNISYDAKDPFTIWFEDTFGNAHLDIETDNSFYADRQKKEQINAALVKAPSKIEALLNLFDTDMQRLHASYKTITDLPPSILKDFKLDKSNLMESLKEKIKGLKRLYWEQVFDNLDEITNRFTSHYRHRYMQLLFRYNSCDFTRDNIYAIVQWAIKNVNDYFDDQIIEVWERMLCDVNAQAYKSNAKMLQEFKFRVQDSYVSREEKQEFKRIKTKLSNRIIMQGGYGFVDEWRGYRFGDNGKNLVDDLIVIAHNTGWRSVYKQYESPERGQWHNVMGLHEGQEKMLFQFKAYLNGNMHIKFGQDFVNHINVIFGKLKGWLHRAQDAAQEMDIDIYTASAAFKASEFRLSQHNVPLLTG